MRKTNTDYVRAYRERQKQALHEAQERARKAEEENAVLRHNLDVRTREAAAVWNQINQIDAGLCVALGRQWKYEELPPPGTAGGAFVIARQLYEDQIKPLPGDDASPS
jgi:hypothetical protein